MHMQRLLCAAAGLSLLAVPGCGPGLDPAQSYVPMECPNFTLEREPMYVSVPPEGKRILLGPNRNWLVFGDGSVVDTARYRITRAIRGRHVLAGVEIQPVDGSPAAFARPVEVRLNYSKCVPEPESGGRGLLRGDSGGRAWRVQEGSGRSLLRREVSGGIVQTAVFAVAR